VELVPHVGHEAVENVVRNVSVISSATSTCSMSRSGRSGKSIREKCVCLETGKSRKIVQSSSIPQLTSAELRKSQFMVFLTGAQADKVIGAVCHGPAGLLGVREIDGTPLVAARTVMAFTDREEREAGLEQWMPFRLESRLRELGAHFVGKPNWSDHVECDPPLITGQNPASSASVAQAIIDVLNA
jgi:hypothetical protein